MSRLMTTASNLARATFAKDCAKTIWTWTWIWFWTALRQSSKNAIAWCIASMCAGIACCMCRVRSCTALQMSGHDHCIMWIIFPTPDLKYVCVFASTMELVSPFVKILPGFSGLAYFFWGKSKSSLKLCISSSYVNFISLFCLARRHPTYLSNSP